MCYWKIPATHYFLVEQYLDHTPLGQWNLEKQKYYYTLLALILLELSEFLFIPIYLCLHWMMY